MAQNVYSLNVVGYANITLNASGFTLFANPLDGTMGSTVPNGNNLTNFFTSVPSGATIFPWIASTASYGNAAAYSVSKGVGAWANPFNVPPGTGFMFKNNATTNAFVTFVGQVQQGTAIPVKSLLAGKSDFVGSPVPIGGNFTNSIVGLAPSSGDSITLYTTGAGWGNANAYSVSKGVGAWSGNTMQIGVGQGFLYKNASTAVNNWTANFTVQ